MSVLPPAARGTWRPGVTTGRDLCPSSLWPERRIGVSFAAPGQSCAPVPQGTFPLPPPPPSRSSWRPAIYLVVSRPARGLSSRVARSSGMLAVLRVRHGALERGVASPRSGSPCPSAVTGRGVGKSAPPSKAVLLVRRGRDAGFPGGGRGAGRVLGAGGYPEPHRSLGGLYGALRHQAGAAGGNPGCRPKAASERPISGPLGGFRDPGALGHPLASCTALAAFLARPAGMVADCSTRAFRPEPLRLLHLAGAGGLVALLAGAGAWPAGLSTARAGQLLQVSFLTTGTVPTISSPPPDYHFIPDISEPV